MVNFSIFIFIWLFGAFVFPVASVATVSKTEEKASEQVLVQGDKTIFVDDYNGKELFELSGNYSKQQIIEHGGKSYLIYYDHVEDKKIFMKVKKISSDSSESEPVEFEQN